ncbi:CD63 antigen [Nomia melanderi]|uniref:CD63 antigen n=1 Tax=Nomia melanderi TaxID=2448451 RepID=UPI001304299C|nr:CD63 antigen [Nomia melanderi]
MVRSMRLPLGSQCVKYLLFVFNLLFVITGVILLSSGVVIRGVYQGYQQFLDNKFLSVPSFLIAIGAIIFFIAFFGCCGAVRENYCMIITFTSLLVLVFILELAGGISGYVLRARASTIIKHRMNDMMVAYPNNTEVSEVWDEMQRKFNCCGTDSPFDWKDIISPLPPSCCLPEEGKHTDTTNCTLTSPTLHHNGCYQSLLSLIASHALQLGGIGIGIAIVQAIGIWFSSYLARSIKNSYETV